MNPQNQAPDFSEQRNEGFTIDFKRIGFRALQYWYVVVISLGLALGAAYLTNRYAQRIYPVTASIIIREAKETSVGDLLYQNSLSDPYRNFFNEPYIIRSYPLILRVIEQLNFGIAFYREGNFKTTEAYGLPVKAKLLKKNGSYGASLIFKIIDEKSFSLEQFEGGPETAPQTFTFGDSLVYRGHHLLFIKDQRYSLASYKNVPFLMTLLDPWGVTGSYVGKLDVKWAEEGSSVLYLSVAGSNPAKEIDFLNGLIKEYQQYDLDKKNQAAERTIIFIKSQLGKISDSLKVSEGQIERFKSENSVLNLNEEGGRLFKKLEPLEMQRADLILRENYYQYLEKYIAGGNQLDQVILPSSVGVSDGILTTLVSRMVELQLDLRLFISKEKGGENPLVISRRNEINQIRKDISESINTLRSTDKIRADFLKTQTDQIEKEIGFLPLAQRRFIAIQRSYTLLENLYVFLMQKMSEAGISKASNSSDVVEVNPPMQGGPISPKTTQNYGIAFIIGLLVPFSIFAVVEILNDKIQSKDDVEKITSIPFIGGVGHNGDKNNLAILAKPKSAVAESFRALRSNLNFFTSNEGKKVFMVTSSVSGEGKTFTTVNLATVFAISGKKTLIVGADMRKPKIVADFNLPNTVGLSGYLSGMNTFSEVVQTTSVPSLDLISGGPVPPNPSELLNENFEKLIKEALEVYEYVIIDTPPMAIVTDAFVLSKYADHTVFVTRQNYTPKAMLRTIQDFYASGKFKNISLLLNDIYRSGHGYGYGYGYGYSYGYGYYGKGKDGYGYYSES